MPLKLSEAERTLRITSLRKSEPRVFVLDRDPMSSHLLADVLVRDLGYNAVAISSAEILRTLAGHESSLVIIGADLSWRSGNGVDLTSAVCHQHPKTAVVVLLKETTKEAVIGAFRSGARGVFCRQWPMSEFLDCVQRVSSGFLWTGRQETTYLLDVIRNIPAPKISTCEIPLTKRELQVVECAARGKSNRSIADELCLSGHTVKNYLFRAFEKLGVSNRTELLFYLTTTGYFPSGVTAKAEALSRISSGEAG